MQRTDEQRAKTRAYYAANRDRINQRQRRKYAANAEQRVAYQQSWRDANRDRVNALARAARYGLTLDQVKGLYAACGNRCQGCGVSERDAPKGRLYIDHDHSCCPGSKACGACVRGLLCLNCNTTLGRCEDDPEVLIRLARYLSDSVDRSDCA